jgi:hypothetical protein
MGDKQKAKAPKRKSGSDDARRIKRRKQNPRGYGSK